MASIPPGPLRRKVVVGVDTHKHVHVAVALDALGGRSGGLTIPATTTETATPGSSSGPVCPAMSRPSAWKAPAPTAPG